MTGSTERIAAVLLLMTLAASPSLLLGQESPAYLPENLRSNYETFSQKPTDRAFALSRDGAWGTAYGRSSVEAARQSALSNCRAYADRCVVIVVNDEVLHAENPFPEPAEEDAFVEYLSSLSDRAVILLAFAGIVLLLVGTATAVHYPLYLFDTWLSDALRLRMNYTIILFGFLYFMLMLPVFFRLRQRDFSNPLTWFVFAAPMLPYVLSVLYLYRKNKLSDRFELQ